MTIQLLKPIQANGGILPEGTLIRIDSPDVIKRLICEGVGRLMDLAELWAEPMEDLVKWFPNAHFAQESFYLSESEHILNPEKYYTALKRGIEAGPNGPRARTGALQDDLQRLKTYCERRKSNA